MPAQHHGKPEQPSDPVATAIVTLAGAVTALVQVKQAVFEWTKSHANLATKQDLETAVRTVMDAITQFKNAVDQSFDRLGSAVDGLAADVNFLKSEIERLQTTPGTLTPEDQAILDGIQARMASVADRVSALDALTEPPAPPAPTP